jgi:FixJ family two-component response regulator
MADAPATINDPLAGGDSVKHPLSIFIVDDDPGALSSLRFMLESEGYAVAEFSSGLDVLAISVDSRPSCVIIDYKMPTMNGIDVFRRLRELYSDLPIILITGHPDPMIRHAAERTGVKLIEKPLSQDELLAAISRVRAAQRGLEVPCAT